MSLALLLALMSAPLAPVYAKSGHTDRARARKAFQHDLVSRLARSSDAQSLLGAALLARTRLDEGGPLGFHQLITRAANAPGAGPGVSWVRLSDCDAAAGNCPNPEAMKALIAQAPENAAVWLLRMGQAASFGHAKIAAQAFGKAARAKYYDDYTDQSLKALAHAVTVLPPPPATLAGPGSHASRVASLQVMMVYGIGAAQPMPGFHLVEMQCLPKVVGTDSGRRRDCLQLARLLARGSSPLARSLGLHMQSTLNPDASTRKRAAELMRNLAWQVQNFSLLQIRAYEELDVAQELLRLARQGGSEISQMQAALHAFGIPLAAPAGWSPRNPLEHLAPPPAGH